MFLLLTLNQIPTWLLYFPFWLWTSKCRIWVSTFTVLFSVGCSIILNKLIFSMKIKIKSLTGVLWSFCFETFHIFWHIFSRYFFCKTSSGYYFALHKKSFPLRISLVNVTKSEENCVLVTFTEEILHWELQFLCSAGKEVFPKASEKNEIIKKKLSRDILNKCIVNDK